MAVFIRQLCALSIFCGAALSLAPEGSVRRAMSFVCSVVLLSFVLGGVKTLDLDAYAVESAALRERQQAFLAESGTMRDELDRRVIEGEFRDYVLEKAAEIGLSLSDCGVEVRWSMEGLWVPYALKLVGPADEIGKQKLAGIIETELGIPESRQEWVEDG